MTTYSIGVDLSQRRGYSAIAAPPEESLVCYLERMPLGTPYTAVAERVVKIARAPRLARNFLRNRGIIPESGAAHGASNGNPGVFGRHKTI